jgi:hypothetical protein
LSNHWPTGLIGIIGFSLIVSSASAALLAHWPCNIAAAICQVGPIGCTSPNSFKGVSCLIGRISLVGQISLVSHISISGISRLISDNGLVAFIGLGLISFIDLGLVSLIGLICHIIGLIGLNGLSLIIGGTNPNVMFAPLGAGGGQQNSGNSAGLQPTTQSNLGTNAGSVGANCNLIFVDLAKKAEQYSLAILWVPTSGTDKMARALLTITSSAR